MGKDYYSILGVRKTASADEIKKAYRRLAHEHHPDKGGDSQKFKDINDAYQVLGDSNKRAQYDRFGPAAFEQGGMGAGGFGGSPFGAGGFNINFEDFGDLSDILGGMFGFGGKQKRKRGQDIQVDVTLDFKEAIFGVDKTVKLYKHNACFECVGSGSARGSRNISCKNCVGRGFVNRVQNSFFGAIQQQVTCEECMGKGEKPEQPCNTCKGFGNMKTMKEVKVNIPAGISENEAMRMTGEGEHPGVGGQPGDLIIRIRIKRDPNFRREGNDILSIAYIPYSLMALGGKIQVDTVDGPVELKIPEATQAGTVFKLRGKGVPFMRSSGRGDHLLTIEAKVEKKLSREQKQTLERLREQGL